MTDMAKYPAERTMILQYATVSLNSSWAPRAHPFFTSWVLQIITSDKIWRLEIYKTHDIHRRGQLVGHKLAETLKTKIVKRKKNAMKKYLEKRMHEQPGQSSPLGAQSLNVSFLVLVQLQPEHEFENFTKFDSSKFVIRLQIFIKMYILYDDLHFFANVGDFMMLTARALPISASQSSHSGWGCADGLPENN